MSDPTNPTGPAGGYPPPTSDPRVASERVDPDAAQRAYVPIAGDAGYPPGATTAERRRLDDERRYDDERRAEDERRRLDIDPRLAGDAEPERASRLAIGAIVEHPATGRLGIVVATTSEHPDGSPIRHRDATPAKPGDAQEHYRIAWFSEVSDPVDPDDLADVAEAERSVATRDDATRRPFAAGR